MFNKEVPKRVIKVALYISEDSEKHMPHSVVDIDVPEHIIENIDVIDYANSRHETGTFPKFAVWIPWTSSSIVYYRHSHKTEYLTF